MPTGDNSGIYREEELAEEPEEETANETIEEETANESVEEEEEEEEAEDEPEMKYYRLICVNKEPSHNPPDHIETVEDLISIYNDSISTIQNEALHFTTTIERFEENHHEQSTICTTPEQCQKCYHNMVQELSEINKFVVDFELRARNIIAEMMVKYIHMRDGYAKTMRNYNEHLEQYNKELREHIRVLRENDDLKYRNECLQEIRAEHEKMLNEYKEKVNDYDELKQRNAVLYKKLFERDMHIAYLKTENDRLRQK